MFSGYRDGLQRCLVVGPVKVRDSNGQLKYYLYVVSTGLGGSLDGLDSGYSCFKRSQS